MTTDTTRQTRSGRHTLVATAADVIARAMGQGRILPAALAVALDSAQMLQSPETAAELARLRARLDVVHRVPQDNLTPAEVRLGQYGERTKTWSTATYDSGIERTLHEIACGLRDTLEETRDQRNAARLLVAGLKDRVAELEALLAEYERPADEDPIALTLTEKAAEVFVPRTEREYWVAIADALNAAHAVGMPVGIDLDGTLTDRNAWSVVWDRGAERWAVAGYEDGAEDPCHPCGCPKRFDRHAWGCPTLPAEDEPGMRPAICTDAPPPAAEEPLTVYRASHDSIVMGLYTTAAEARKHCETEMRRDLPTVALDWIEDEEDDVAELVASVGEDERVTGYVVEALEVAAAYDEEADE